MSENIIKLCLHVTCACPSASTSTSTLTLSHWLTQGMGFRPILCMCVCVTNSTILINVDVNIDANGHAHVTCKQAINACDNRGKEGHKNTHTLACSSQPTMIPLYPQSLCLMTWPILYFTASGRGLLGSGEPVM